MDITEFITWFISQVVNIFTWCFNLLDSITFAGTSLLKVIVTIIILVPLLSVVLTLFKGVDVYGSKSEHVENLERRASRDKYYKNKN